MASSTRPAGKSGHWVFIGAILLLLAAPQGVRAEEVLGRVVRIADGDTLTVLTADNEQVRVRLSEIDAPEKDQPYGQKAKQALSDLAFGKDARIAVDDTDRYGRTVGQVFVGNLHVNSELVRQGAAWCYRRYLRGSWCLLAEHGAKQAGRGLWALQEDQRVPPWEWRQARRE